MVVNLMVLEGAPIGADSATCGWGPGSHSDEPYGEEPWAWLKSFRLFADALKPRKTATRPKLRPTRGEQPITITNPLTGPKTRKDK